MRSLGDCRTRWELTLGDKTSLQELKDAVENKTGGNPCLGGLRSVCWKAFLLFENIDQSTWSKKLSDSRSAYSALRERFLHDIEHPDDLDSAGDPLTADDNSPWNTLRQDELLRAEICQDVERCMPDNFYFREPKTQTMLLNILFIFCKLHQDVGYRQGMHELLAPVLWVIDRDAVERKMSDDSMESPASQDLMEEVVDSVYTEHDSFTIFSAIMQTAKSFYELGVPDQQAAAAPRTMSRTQKIRSPIILRSQRIHEDLLASVDPQLAAWLKEIEVLPQVFIIRWIRLLFGREFPFDDVLSLWDSLFAEDPALELVDLVCVAMLLRIRWQLLEADYSTALTLLLRYPKPSASPSGFVKDALYLQKNLTVEGGRHIVFKYSRRKTDVQQSGVESTLPVRASRIVDAQAKPRRPSKTSNAKIRNSTRSPLPLPSPAKFFQEQGGVEGIIRGALGEMKKNVQFLQNGSPPRRGLYLPQSSVGDTQAVSSTTSGITSRIDALEQRNKALAKMLEDSLKGLWEHQKVATEDKSKIDVDALSLAIAKVQFVHVYLEDSAMPLPLQGESIHPSPESLDANTVPQSKHMAISGSETTAPKPASTASEDVKTAEPNVVSSDGPESTSRRTSRPQASGAPGIQPSPFQHPRPSLAQSSFSWMLGEDQRRTSFVAASRFPPEMKRGSDARGKTGFLFGDDKSQHGDGLESEAGTDHEEFTLGSLRAISDES